MQAAHVALALAALMATGAVAQQVSLKPEEVIGGRRAAYYLSGALVSEMQYSVEHGGDPKHEVFAANAIANWARRLPTMFPAGSDAPPTHASPTIWTDRAGLKQRQPIMLPRPKSWPTSQALATVLPF